MLSKGTTSNKEANIDVAKLLYPINKILRFIYPEQFIQFSVE